MLRKTAWFVGVGVALGLLQVGCGVEAGDGDRFREAIPEAADVSLGVPGAATDANAQALVAPSLAERARFYKFTRDVSEGVDRVTRSILGSIWLVVHTQPSSVEPHRATWGPGADALSPVVWRLRVTEVGDGVFDYQLDGRPKGSTNESDYLTVLKGRGYGRSHAEHRNGSFTVDNDAARTLDPARASDHGTTKIVHHLRAWPAKIDVAIRPTPDPNWLDIAVTHERDGSGAVDVSGRTDVEETNKDGNLEDIVLHNRWAASGAGRADVQITAGSVPILFKASECWSPVFARTYYVDNAGTAAIGDSASCVFPDASF